MEDRLTLHCRRIAALGGSARSEKKAAAARENARKPRPKARKVNDLSEAKNN
jgi:hypothetical protein